MSDQQARIDAFITDEVRDIAEQLEERTRQNVLKRGMTKTRALEKSIKSAVQAAMAGRASYTLNYLLYGRFVDMGARPGWNKGQRQGSSREDLLSARRGAPRKRIWYSREKMGLFARLTTNLGNKYLDHTAEMIADQLLKTNG